MVAVSRKDGTGECYASLLFKREGNFEAWLLENGLGNVHEYMRAQGKPLTFDNVENELDVRLPHVKFFDWLGDEPRHLTRMQMVTALKSLLEFFITWSQASNVKFKDAVSYESKTKELQGRLYHVGKRLQRNAVEDRTRQELSQPPTEWNTRLQEAQRVLEEVPIHLKNTFDVLREEGDNILSVTMQRAGFLLQILALAGIGCRPQTIRSMTALDFAS